jgi:two-component system cell cycle response regulator CtrA
MRALLVDDDAVSTRLVQKAIEPKNYLVEHTDTGEEALEMVRLYDFDVVILDLDLPDMNGIQVVQRLRAAEMNLPVLMLSSSDDRQQMARALLAGADDYMTKPFVRDELTARLQAVIRRSKGHAASQIRVGRMVVDIGSRTVAIDGKPLEVTAKEYSVLELLALRKGITLTKEAFLDHLYGGLDEPEHKIIDVFICKLRKKIAAVSDEDHGIKTVWGRGYMLQDPTEGTPGLAEDGTPFDTEGSAPRLSELDLLLLELLPGG